MANYTIESITARPASNGKEAFVVVARFVLPSGEERYNANGVWIEIDAGGGAAAVKAELEAHWQRELDHHETVSTPVPTVPDDIAALVPAAPQSNPIPLVNG